MTVAISDRNAEDESRLHKPGVVGSSPTAAICDSVHIDHQPAKLYHLRPGVSASQLKVLARSPVAFYDQYIRGISPHAHSAALSYGSLLHEWAEFGDEAFWSLAQEYPESVLTPTGQVGKAAKEWAAGQPEGSILVTPSDFRKLREQTRQLMLNKAWVKLSEESIDREFNVSFRWNGHDCRCRGDGATQYCWYDLKTTKEDDPWESAWRAVDRFGYSIQAAFYREAALQAGWPDHSLHFVFTSTTTYLNCVVTLPPEIMERGRVRCLRLLEELKQRREWNQWLPHYYGAVHQLKCPAFMGRDNDAEV